MFEIMIDRVINKFGFEAPETIQFAFLCENPYIHLDTVLNIYNDLMNKNVFN